MLNLSDLTQKQANLLKRSLREPIGELLVELLEASLKDAEKKILSLSETDFPQFSKYQGERQAIERLLVFLENLKEV